MDSQKRVQGDESGKAPPIPKEVSVPEIFRLSSTRPQPLVVGQTGSCAACDKPVAKKDRAVRLYGDLFHYDCAFHRARGGRDGRSEADRG